MHTTTRSTTIATHNGSFHADDVFGVAVLRLLFPEATLLRTRDAALIAAADYAVDVGGEWDAARGRFDHHQRGFDGARASGVVYASAGLVWAAHGPALVAQQCGVTEPTLVQAIADSLDRELVQHLDRADTGAANAAPGLFGLSALLAQFNLPWDRRGSAAQDDAAALARFEQAMGVVTQLLLAALDQQRARHQGAQQVREARVLLDGRVLVLPRGGLPWRDVASAEMPDLWFVVYPDASDEQHQVHVVTVEPQSFTARKDLPRAWAGLREAELAAASGVADAVFCHNGRFIAGARSLDGALRLAELAVAAPFDPK
ncbi:MYG1 family protein [Pseudorhodoferax soli]|uniref:Uncharacterized UPF0160 family protein n=1 Tax=Pseudorhodoferax soli TaxID=545864 RepID=A0A368Y705_9BURK|nr:MYG1 family protein [Pseudorhodoferax soli]RCW75509.1 uncharacterized UPF0160 family protein [Pseudorhodoferax soli]